MSRDWNVEEVEATVADYFAMLEAELRGIPYSKSAHRRALQNLLVNRSETAIERKHMNVSAVLRDLGHPWIDGYKPLGNYQRRLRTAVEARLRADGALAALVENEATQPASPPPMENLLAIWEPPPELEHKRTGAVSEPSIPYVSDAGVQKDYLALEAANRSLGRAGEELVLAFEAHRLHHLGAKKLAKRIEHVSSTRGDGLGFDVLSFETDGRERLIEVKTTSFGRRTPFFVTRAELACSKDQSERFHVYRLYAFRHGPRLFGLQGAIDSTCQLTPTVFSARVA